jgi:hypothetical protein
MPESQQQTGRQAADGEDNIPHQKTKENTRKSCFRDRYTTVKAKKMAV